MIQSIFTVLAKLLYATSHNDRLMALLVPTLWEEPKWVDVEFDEDGVAYWNEIRIFFPADDNPNVAPDRVTPGLIPVDPAEAFDWMTASWGEVVGVASEGENKGKIHLVSPLLARHLGLAPGGQLNLYSAQVYQFGQLVQSPAMPEDKTWAGEWKQWLASHSRAVMDAMLGGEIEREQAKAGMLAKCSRGKGVYSAKIGGWMFNVLDVHGNRHTAKPGEIYVSTSSPLAVLDGLTVIPWRNPMPFLDACTLKAVGPATPTCPKPSIETTEDILPDSKIFAHPFQVSKTAGDVDGDGWQFLCLEKLLGWACKDANQAAVDAVPGLREGLMHYFLEEE